MFLHVSVILSTREGGTLSRGGAWSSGGGSGPGPPQGLVLGDGGAWSRGGCLVETPLRMATAAGGTHPTGMHSC